MTSCRARLLAGAALTLVLVAPALAQTGKPTPLAPPQGQRTNAAPVRPAATIESQPLSTETAKPGEASVAPVAANELRPVDAESLGLLSEQAGGFGVNLYANTRRDVVEALLPVLPAAAAAPSVQSLERRILLSIALPPEGDRGQRGGLMPLRIERLYARGDLTSVMDLVNALPAREIDGRVAIARANARLLTDDTAGACQDARQRLSAPVASAGPKPAGPGGLFWDKLAAFCDLQDKDIERAQFGLALVRDQGDKDQAFFTLAAALMGDAKAQVRSLPEATPLHLAMLRAANQKLPDDTGPLNQPPIARGVAIHPGASPAQKLEAAHRAALYGALSPEELARAYGQAEFPPAQVKNAFAEAAKQGGVRARALLYRAAQEQTQPQGRAEALRALYQLGRTDGDFALLARVSLPLLLEMRPAREQAWFASDAGRALYSTRRLAEAKTWYDAAVQAAGSDRDAAAAVLTLWPLARLADGDAAAPWSGERFRQWRAAVEAGKPETVAPRLAMALLLFDAFAEPVIGVDFQALHRAPSTQTAPMPAALTWFGMREASAEGRVGETVLHTLVALGEADLGKHSPIVVANAVGTLKALGLEKDARALAVDAAIQAGL